MLTKTRVAAPTGKSSSSTPRCYADFYKKSQQQNVRRDGKTPPFATNSSAARRSSGAPPTSSVDVNSLGLPLVQDDENKIESKSLCLDEIDDNSFNGDCKSTFASRRALPTRMRSVVQAVASVFQEARWSRSFPIQMPVVQAGAASHEIGISSIDAETTVQ